MPEGDTLHAAAARVGPALTGHRLVKVDGSHRTVAGGRRRLTGATVTEVVAIGKHLLIHTDRGWSVRTHLGMTGWWSIYRPGEPWRSSPGKARVVLSTDTAVAVCFAAPTVEIGPTDQIMSTVAHLGPDLVTTAGPYPEVVTAALGHPGPTVADVLLDQRVASGVGNVYKSEILFLEHIHPWSPPATVGEDGFERLFRRAHRLLAANVRPGPRQTTGNRHRDLHWVYGRSDEPCRRCGTPIEEGRHGELQRLTTWCPSCQPMATDTSTTGSVA